MPILLNQADRAKAAEALKTTERVGAAAGLDDRILLLAQHLATRHGNVRAAKEESGLHLYMASPICLEKDGLIELKKMHLAVNVEKWLAGKDNCGLCMKTSTPYSVKQLLRMPPLDQRGLKNIPKGEVITTNADNAHYFEQDAQGNKIPKHPGQCVLLDTLPPEHPAVMYLSSRGVDVARMVRKYRTSYCLRDRPEIWRPTVGQGFRISPQGRLIMFVDMRGVQVAWQARVLQADDEQAGIRYHWNGVREEWQATERLTTGKPEGLPGWENFDPVRYYYSPGAARNSILMGFDHAVYLKSVYKDNRGLTYSYLLEGGLDAERFDPAVASTGKYVSEKQLDLMCEEFQHIIYIPDNDKAGTEATERILTAMQARVRTRLTIAKLPTEFKDAGSMNYQQTQAFHEDVMHGKFQIL